MHTYRKSKIKGVSSLARVNENLWTVGYFDVSNHSRWVALRDFGLEKQAAAYVNYLNGGHGAWWPE